MKRGPSIDRREFLLLSALATGTVGLMACTATPPATPTKAPAAAPASTPVTAAPTKVPAVVAPTAPPPSAAPTQPPAATAAPAAVATKAPAVASPTPAAKLGAQLMGKLEGPEFIIDPARTPKKFKEAPMLADLVKAGKLPPVEQRLPEEPLVVKPVHEIGKYGGTIRCGFNGAGDKHAGYRNFGHDNLLWLDYTGNKIVPNLAKTWEVSPDLRSFTLTLRKGLKWSDGKPMTTDDIMFGWDDVLLNKELTPTFPATLTINGKLGKLEKIDDLTVRYTFPEPYGYFPSCVAFAQPGVGNVTSGAETRNAGYYPAHYLKQFHPKYVAKDELDKKVKEAGFDNWTKLFINKASWVLNTELPSMACYVSTSPINKPVWTLERNPYYYMVDTEGNQLPYVDKWTQMLGETLEVINLRAIAGEYDFQSRHMDLTKLPVFLENKDKGNYRIFLDPSEFGADAGYLFNLAYDADPEIAKWIGNRDFRRALSLGIQRDQINEAFILGLGTVGSPIPSPNNLYYPGDNYRKLWHTYDPKQASEMLGKIGLDKKDGEGYRLRTDGKGRLRLEVMTMAGQFLQFAQISEMVRQDWKKIGIDMTVTEIERSLFLTRNRSNESQIGVWGNDNIAPEIFFGSTVLPVGLGDFTFHGMPYAQWYQSNGASGRKPTDQVLLGAMDKYRRAFGVAPEERVKIGKEIWATSVDEVWTIGTVGLSPANYGMRVAKNNLGNQPAGSLNAGSGGLRPGSSLPETYFYKQ